MPLKGLKVIELAGLAPAPFCGMVLADFGASVVVVDKINGNDELDCLRNGKASISIDLKKPLGVKLMKTLCRTADVLIEPFRKGVMEKLGLGPDILLKDNPKLIYARLSGYGQNGYFSNKAGHDINYVAMSGLLSLFGRSNENPAPPLNLVADFGGGGLMCTLGILLALIDRTSSGLGQVVDNSMVHGAAYLGSWIYRSQNLPIWGEKRGQNILDTGRHFYEVYKTKDEKYISVGALEPKFYENLLIGLDIAEEEAPQFGDYNEIKKLFTETFLKKTLEEWCDIFETSDACIAPVLELNEAPKHPHNKEERYFQETKLGIAPTPAPKLSRTPGHTQSLKKTPTKGQHTKEILSKLGFDAMYIKYLEKEGIINSSGCSKL